MKEVVQNVNRYLNGAGHVLLEAAHIYADKQPGNEQLHGAKIAASIIKGLNRPVTTCLLVDDLNVREKSLDVPTYSRWLAECGFMIDQVIMEADLVPEAVSLLERIRESVPRKKLRSSRRSDVWVKDESLAMWTHTGRIPLLTQVGRPACVLLDAALYLRKVQGGIGVCVTILPDCYKGQQAQTQAVLRSVGELIPIVNVFFSPEDPYNVNVIGNFAEEK